MVTHQVEQHREEEDHLQMPMQQEVKAQDRRPGIMPPILLTQQLMKQNIG
jgi:hypothetical protein